MGTGATVKAISSSLAAPVEHSRDTAQSGNLDTNEHTKSSRNLLIEQPEGIRRTVFGVVDQLDGVDGVRS